MKDEHHSDKATVVEVLSPPPSRPKLQAEKGVYPPVFDVNDVFLKIATVKGERSPSAVFFVVFVGITLLTAIMFPTLFIVAPYLLLMTLIPAALFFLFMLLSPKYPPIRLNRATGEVYYYDGLRLYREPWETLLARITVSYAPGAIYGLQFGFRRPGRGPLWLSVGGGHEEIAHRHWAYYCGYIKSGTALEMVEVPHTEHSTPRQQDESLVGRFFGEILLFPIKMINSLSIRLSLVPWLSLRGGPIKYPKEIIDLCENHPEMRR